MKIKIIYTKKGMLYFWEFQKTQLQLIGLEPQQERVEVQKELQLEEFVVVVEQEQEEFVVEVEQVQVEFVVEVHQVVKVEASNGDNVGNRFHQITPNFPVILYFLVNICSQTILCFQMIDNVRP